MSARKLNLEAARMIRKHWTEEMAKLGDDSTPRKLLLSFVALYGLSEQNMRKLLGGETYKEPDL
jgi:hypothetical protein